MLWLHTLVHYIDVFIVLIAMEQVLYRQDINVTDLLHWVCRLLREKNFAFNLFTASNRVITRWNWFGNSLRQMACTCHDAEWIEVALLASERETNLEIMIVIFVIALNAQL